MAADEDVPNVEFADPNAQNDKDANQDANNDDPRSKTDDPDFQDNQRDQLWSDRINAKNCACDDDLDCCAKTVWWISCCNAYCFCRSDTGCSAFCCGNKCSDKCGDFTCLCCCPCGCCVGWWADCMRGIFLGSSGFWYTPNKDN